MQWFYWGAIAACFIEVLLVKSKEEKMIRYTLVCQACCAGWEGDKVEGNCSLCGKPGEVRGQYRIVPIPMKVSR